MLRWLLAAFLLLFPALAHAESAIVLVPDAPVGSDALERVRSAAIEVLAERGVRLLRAPDGEVCDAARCAAALGEQAGASLVVLVLVEATDDGAAVRARVVRPGDSQRHEARARVGDSGFGPASAAALARALESAGDRRLGFLMVRTTPSGAAVEIDGEPAGTSPLRRMVTPGEHRVRVVRADGQAREQTAVVRPVTESAVEIDFAEEQDLEDTSSEAATESQPSPLNFLIGGGLAIAGVAALISPLQTLATEGECVDEIENVGCVERVQFGAVSGVLLGVGLAALIGAVIVDVVAPIRVDVVVGAERGMLQIRGQF